MIGSIFKYGAVLLVGAVGFSTAAYTMDLDIVAQARKDLDLKQSEWKEKDPIELTELMKAYVKVRRAEWVNRLTFASSIKDLDYVLKSWI